MKAIGLYDGEDEEAKGLRRLRLRILIKIRVVIYNGPAQRTCFEAHIRQLYTRTSLASSRMFTILITVFKYA